jgi:hypothetical protein
LKRRTFTHLGIGAAALAFASPWRDCFAIGAAIGRDSPARMLVLIDSTLPASRASTALWTQAKVLRLEAGSDVGLLWHNRLRDWTGVIRGALRPSDCFVLRNMSMSDGRAFHSSPMRPHSDAASERAVTSRHALRATAVLFFEIS